MYRRDVAKGSTAHTGRRRLAGGCQDSRAPSARRRGRRVGGESQSRGGRKRTTDRAGVTGREPRLPTGYSRQGPVKFGGRVEHPQGRYHRSGEQVSGTVRDPLADPAKGRVAHPSPETMSPRASPRGAPPERWPSRDLRRDLSSRREGPHCNMLQKGPDERFDYVPPCRPEHRRGSYGTVAVIVVDRACGPRRPRRTT